MTRTWQLVRREGGTADITEGCWVKLRNGWTEGPVTLLGDAWNVAHYSANWSFSGVHESGQPEYDITHVSTEGPSDGLLRE